MELIFFPDRMYQILLISTNTSLSPQREGRMIWDKANEKTQSTKSTWVVNNFGTKKNNPKLASVWVTYKF